MAKYTFDQIKCNVAEIANRNSYTKDFIFELMAAYGRSASSIKQLKTGTINKSTDKDALLQKGVVFLKLFPAGTRLEEKVEEMDMDPLSGRYEPRYIIATDLKHIVAKDMAKHTTLDIEIKDIDNEVAFFYGWTGNEINEGSADESAADRRAADKMKDLYDEIERENIEDFQARPVEFRHDLNVFFSRLLFCFFAEDTGLFQPKQFVGAIKEFTETDGSDLHLFFEELFKSLDSEDKSGMTTPFSEFPYVNGSLFDTKSHNIMIPKFSPTARHILTLCADLDWSGVNPDIFGTIFQGIVDEARRDENGMDYTSVPNILKVIDPLFMNELHEEFDKAFDNEKKLYALWTRISKIKIFDPACGSGNFLIISYKKLRELEHDIIRRISELMEERGIKGGLGGYALASQIKLDHFFGIELEDFPRELAELSMYIAAHQMNIEFEKEFGKKLSIIPLRQEEGKRPKIMCANSARINWNAFCPNNNIDEIYIIGNPPYKGGKKIKDLRMKEDVKLAHEGRTYSKNVDYISIWFIKACNYIRSSMARAAFVSTNSVCQGEQVSMFWPYIFSNGVEITFAHTSFKWSNNAKDQAGVTCIIVGLANTGVIKNKLVFRDDQIISCSHINAYLVPDGKDILVEKRSSVLSGLPKMSLGSMPKAKALILTKEDADSILEFDSESKKYVKRYIGSDSFINSIERYCLWINDSDVGKANQNNIIRKHLEAVRSERLESDADSTKELAKAPWRFAQRAYQPTTSLIIPRISTERRKYIPIGMLDESYIVSDGANVIYDAEPWMLAILSSAIHNAWVKFVSGGLETRINYSSTICYNAFPCSLPTEAQKEKLNQSARNILFARANHPELTLADMYDPDKMPDDLRKAHEDNDVLVDKLYRSTPFQNDEARLAVLFKLYEEMTSREK